MINDNNFLQKSFLGNFYKFAPKNDPFLFRPILTIEKDNQKINEFAMMEDKKDE